MLGVISSCSQRNDFDMSSQILNKFVLEINHEWGDLSDFKKNYDYPYITITENSLKDDTLYFLDSRKKLKVNSSLDDLFESIFLKDIIEINYYSKNKIEFTINKTSSIFGEKRTSYLFYKSQDESDLLDCKTEKLDLNWYLINCRRSY